MDINFSEEEIRKIAAVANYERKDTQT